MKTIGTTSTNKAATGPDFIEDTPSPTSPEKGKRIGELVSGNKESAESELAAEEAHWRQNHASQPFAGGYGYEEFGPAYRAGIKGYLHHSTTGKSFDETETELRERYETENGSPKLPWVIVRPASHAAWHRFARRDRSS